MQLHARKTNQPPGPRRTRGYILVVVMGFVAVATSLGLAFLDANSTVMPGAVNYKATIRAQYVAGSGMAMASHYLMYPPTTVAYGAYWTGANNVSVDGSADTFNVSVLRSDGWSPPQSDPNLFLISAAGTALDPDGSVRSRRTVTAEVLAPLTQRWQIPYAYLATGSVTFPAQATINGDAHANNSLSGSGFCQGKLSAVSTCLWTGTGPPASVTSLAPSYTPTPSTTPSLYSTYSILGRTYSAYTSYSRSEINQSDANTLNAINMSATNPGRIIMAPAGNFKLRVNAQLNGTLVVNGRLEIDDQNTHGVTAVSSFPALVVTGDIKILDNNCTLNVAGAVICAGQLDVNGKSGFILNATGPWIVQGGITGTRSDNQLRFTYSAQRSVFWDFQNAVPPKPITVLSWKEN